MGWLDPHECKVADEYLRQGQAAEAARVLLKSKHPKHKTVVELKLQAGRELLEQARQLAKAQQWQAAHEAIELAAQCLELAGEDRRLQLEIQKNYQQQQRLRQWRQKKLQQARRQAERGHLHTAQEMVKAAGQTTTAIPLQREIQERMGRFRRYLAQCRQALDRGDTQLALQYFRKARRLCAHDAQLDELAQRIGLCQTSEPEPRSSQPAAGKGRFLLGRLALVVTQPQVCVGTPRSPEAEIPLLGPLHSRHAVLFCDHAGWSISACRDRHGNPCKVWLNNQPIPGNAGLRNGDRLTLGQADCGWRFRQNVPGSATAVLEPLLERSPTLAVSGTSSTTSVVLLRDRLVLAQRAPAHLVVPELPCSQVELTLNAEGLLVEVQDGTFCWETESGIVPYSEQAVWPPARLVIDPDEVQRLAQVLSGSHDAETLELELKPV